MTNLPTNFLFVNASNDSPAYKVGARQQIRSQVRKHVAKQLRQKHKIEQEKESTGYKLMRLASKSPGYNASEPLLHDTNCPSLAKGPILDGSNTNRHAPNKALPERELESSCKACRLEAQSPISWKLHTNEGGMVGIRQRRKGVAEPNPLQLIGAGRVDPFLSFPIDKPDRALHELMDLMITYLIPGLVPDDHQNHLTNPVNSVAKAWLSTALKTPFLLHALLFAASIHSDFLHLSKIYPNSPQALSHKLIVIRKVNEFISDRSNASRDEVILAILVLASHEVINVTEEKNKPFNSPLKTIQWLNVYGNIQYVPEHMKAVLDLVTWRGGIENLELHGLAETIVIGDIVAALNSSSKPFHAPLRIHETYFTSIKDWAKSSLRAFPQTKATSFRRLSDQGITDDMLQVFESMGAITIAIDHYLQGKPAGLTLGQIARTRTAIQKRLLLLPTALELDITSPPRPNIYECCRLTAIIFSVAVIFPIPNTYDVLQDLVRRLQVAIESSEIESYGAEYLDVFLWILVLGGIAALDKPERMWYESQLALVVERMNIDWGGVEKILEAFLWLDIACGPGGRKLWDAVVKLVA